MTSTRARLLDCTIAALAFAANGNEASLLRALESPFSGVSRLELGKGADHALSAKARALAALGEAPTARAAIDAFARALDFEAQLTADERFEWDAIVAIAAGCDARGERGLGALRAALLASTSHPEPAPALPIEPLPHLAPETPRPVKRELRPFSASSLGTYADCERKWYYKYVCRAVDDPGSTASAYGSAFHKALEGFHGEFPRADAASEELLARKLEAYVNEAFAVYRSLLGTPVEFELQTRRARRTAKRYLAWWIATFRARPSTVFEIEAEAPLAIDGYDFTGYIDRLDREDATGNVAVIDYKTGKIAETAAEYREGVANLVDFQLPFYYWARTAAGDRVTRLILIPLKSAIVDVAPIELEIVPVAVPNGATRQGTTGAIGIDELERARTRMGEIARTLRDEPIEHFAVTTDPSDCEYCAYLNSCRERPHATEDRFGR